MSLELIVYDRQPIPGDMWFAGTMLPPHEPSQVSNRWVHAYDFYPQGRHYKLSWFDHDTRYIVVFSFEVCGFYMKDFDNMTPVGGRGMPWLLV